MVWEGEYDYRPWLEEGEWDLKKPHRLLSNFLRKHDIEYFELLPPFLDYSQKEGAKRLALQTDAHYNSDGHQLAAQLIYDYLLQNGLIPKREIVNVKH